MNYDLGNGFRVRTISTTTSTWPDHDTHRRPDQAALSGRDDLLKQLSLNSSTTHCRQVLGITAFSAVSSGTLVVKTLNSGRVYLDGVALIRF